MWGIHKRHLHRRVRVGHNGAVLQTRISEAGFSPLSFFSIFLFCHVLSYFVVVSGRSDFFSVGKW